MPTIKGEKGLQTFLRVPLLKGKGDIMMKHIHCPVNSWDCPYYTDEGHPCRCLLENPMEDCDDFATFWDPEDDYHDDDWDPCAECGACIPEDEYCVSACNCCENANYYSDRS